MSNSRKQLKKYRQEVEEAKNALANAELQNIKLSSDYRKLEQVSPVSCSCVSNAYIGCASFFIFFFSFYIGSTFFSFAWFRSSVGRGRKAEGRYEGEMIWHPHFSLVLCVVSRNPHAPHKHGNAQLFLPLSDAHFRARWLSLSCECAGRGFTILPRRYLTER